MPKVVPEYKEKARERIIEEALKLFSKKGFRSVRMLDIAKKLGVSKGAIYQYFKSKEELFTAVIESRIQFRQEKVYSFIKSRDLNVFATEEFFDMLFNYYPAFSPNLYAEAHLDGETIRKIRESSQQGFDKLVGFFDQLKNDGIIKREIDAKSFSLGFLAMRDGLYNQMQMGLDTQIARKTWTDVMKLLVDGISITK